MFDLQSALLEHRPALLRHCYRMLGSLAEAEDTVQDALERAWKSRATYRGEAPLSHWLLSIATNTCLTALDRRRRLTLPQLQSEPSGVDFAIGATEPERYVTPAPDSTLFPDPEASAESRESVALAFIALLQRLPPRQRAAVLMKDVLGWPADEIGVALGLSTPSVNAALNRGRKALAQGPSPADEPDPSTVRDFVRAWESGDLDALVALLRDDIVLAMPPYALWFRGLPGVVGFLRSPGFASFWSAGVELSPARHNGCPAFVFHRLAPDGTRKRHSVMVARFLKGKVAEMTVFLGPTYLSKFESPAAF